jgi:hypothetical protein
MFVSEFKNKNQLPHGVGFLTKLDTYTLFVEEEII